MKKAGNKKSAEKTRSAVSPGLRAVNRLQQAVSSAREKLAKRYEKSIRMAEKEIAGLSLRLGRLQKAGASGRPVRGRKPARNAAQVLQNGLRNAQSELDQLIQGYEKILAEGKSLQTFEKEWKKTGAKAIKAKIAEKAAKKAKAEEKSKTVKKSSSAKKTKSVKAVRAEKPAKAIKKEKGKQRKKNVRLPAEVNQPSESADMNLPEAEVA